MPMDGNDGVEHIMRTSPMGKTKPLKNLVRTFQRLQFIFLIGIPTSNVLLPVYKTLRWKVFLNLPNDSMPKV